MYSINLKFDCCKNSKCIMRWRSRKIQRDIQKLEQKIEQSHVKLETKKIERESLEKQLSVEKA